MTATPEELIERLHALAAAGVKQVAFLATPEAFTEFVRELGEKVIAKFYRKATARCGFSAQAVW